MVSPDIIDAHKHSAKHRDEIQSSEICGCFYCLAIFSPQTIDIWFDDGHEDDIERTALCPECGIDSVIGSASGYPITKEFRTEMYQYWFERSVEI